MLRSFHERGVKLNMDVEMPTVETIRWMVERDLGVAFLPRMCVEQEIAERQARVGARPGNRRGTQNLSGAALAPRGQLRGGSVFAIGPGESGEVSREKLILILALVAVPAIFYGLDDLSVVIGVPARPRYSTFTINRFYRVNEKFNKFSLNPMPPIDERCVIRCFRISARIRAGMFRATRCSPSK